MPTASEKPFAVHRRLNRAIIVAAILAGLSASVFYYGERQTNVALTATSKPSAEPAQNVAGPVVGQSSQPAIAASKMDPAVFHLSEAGALVGKDDVRVPPADQTAGYVDLITFDGPNTFISGWAADAAHKQPAARVLVFVNGTSAASVEPSKSRPDVSASFNGAWAEPSGFVATVQLPAGKTPSTLVVRVFAFDADGKARELIYPATYPFRRQ